MPRRACWMMLIGPGSYSQGLLGSFRQTGIPSGGSKDWVPESLQGVRLSTDRLASEVGHDGKVQFGNLGRGNHFMELQRDAEGILWIMVHSGSRGIGQEIAMHHMSQAKRSNTGLLYFEADRDAGRAYLHDAGWAVEYARESRARMLESATMLLEELYGIQSLPDTRFDSVHNFVRLERHEERDVYVHRKGANSAADGEMSIIPGSMGTASYHVSGRGHEEALSSCSHGAGRTMSRSDARGSISEKVLRRDMQGVYFDDSRARYLRDEAPGAYKEIDAVMRAQGDLVKQVRRLTLVLNHRG